MTYSLFLILILIVAVILVLIIMVQNPKGGGLSSSFGGGAQSMGGVQSTNSFLDKATWTLGIALMALILLSNFAIPREGASNQSEIENITNERSIQDDAETLPDAEEVETPAESAE